MRHFYCRIGLAFAVLLLAGMWGAALAQDAVIELVPDGFDRAEPIPADCSSWHELWPSFCVIEHQDAYEDANDDGMLSPCDFITLDGTRYHITWVGPTYYLDCDIILEPIDPVPGDPVCQEWIEINPNYGNIWHVVDWADNGDGVVGPCDFITIAGSDGTTLQCHITDVGVNIHIVGDPTPSEQGSWSQLKTLFGIPF